jgi:hypothetical protein
MLLLTVNESTKGSLQPSSSEATLKQLRSRLPIFIGHMTIQLEKHNKNRLMHSM